MANLQQAAESMDITIRVLENPDVLTIGLREEYDNCLRDGTPAVIAMVSTNPSSGNEDIVVLWLPDDGRAGLSSNHGTGNDQWTDAKSIQDAVLRYENDEMNP